MIYRTCTLIIKYVENVERGRNPEAVFSIRDNTVEGSDIHRLG